MTGECFDVKQLVHFQLLTGTGGAISIKTDESILITPSGVLKESVSPEDIFSLHEDGQIITSPPKNLKYSSCFPNFRHIYNLRYMSTFKARTLLIQWPDMSGETPWQFTTPTARCQCWPAWWPAPGRGSQPPASRWWRPCGASSGQTPWSSPSSRTGTPRTPSPRTLRWPSGRTRGWTRCSSGVTGSMSGGLRGKQQK